MYVWYKGSKHEMVLDASTCNKKLGLEIVGDEYNLGLNDGSAAGSQFGVHHPNTVGQKCLIEYSVVMGM